MLAILERAVWSSLQYFTQGQERKRREKILMLRQHKQVKICFGSLNYMGTCSQAPCAAPGQRQMGMHHVSLIILLYFRMLLLQITQVCTN